MPKNAIETENSYSNIIKRFAALSEYANNISPEAFYGAFSRAGYGLANMPQIQNQRVKGISSLPVDYTKEQIGDFLRAPYGNEKALRQTSQVLRWTSYSYFKITKTYQDIPTYHYYTKPLYLTGAKAKENEFMREAVLLDKLNKKLNPSKVTHKITGEAVTQGKVFYVPRIDIDKPHNKVNYAFMQQLPEDWCRIIGFNSVSGYTISFDMMYFLQPGADWRQFGDLFAPYVEDFNNMFKDKTQDKTSKYIYAATNTGKPMFYPENIRSNASGTPTLWQQNGVWAYYVSLPINRVWTFEIDDVSPCVVSPLSGLMLTYAQQSDFEAAQLQLILSPLIKIFTGEIPYFDDKATTKEDAYKLSIGGRAMYEAFWNQLMQLTNTGGTAFYTAPVENIKSHDYAESANANEISSSFNRYGIEKSGLAGVIPSASDPKAGIAEMSGKLESKFSATTIYSTFERMMNYIYESLKLKYDWQFVMFGSIYIDETIRKNAEKAIEHGDTSAHFILAALDNESWIDKLSMCYAINESGLLDLLLPPVTSYTMKQETNGGIPPQNKKEAGRPSKSIEGNGDDKASEGSESTIDTRGAIE